MIGGGCLAGLWREKMREKECEKERESVKGIGLRGREKMQNFKCKKFCTNLPRLTWLIENIYL